MDNYNYDRRASTDLKKMVEQTLTVIRNPWKAKLTKATRKDVPIGVNYEFWVSVSPPSPRGTSFGPVTLGSTFKFYVFEVSVGPKKGAVSLQSIQVLGPGTPERLHPEMTLGSLQEAAKKIRDLLAKHGYETTRH